MNILIIEDERKIAKAIEESLRSERHSVETALSGEDGYFLVTTKIFDLVILDLMLPGRDGLQILTALRSKGIHIPVLVLTARDTVEDRVSGLDRGADDYLIKPFAMPELLARVRALLRRGKTDPAMKLKMSDLEIDLIKRKVSRGGQQISLTGREFELLEYLFRHRGYIVSREMLAKDIWRETQRATPLDNVIDVHIARLRKKIDEPFPDKLLHTVRGIGFILSEKEI